MLGKFWALHQIVSIRPLLGDFHERCFRGVRAEDTKTSANWRKEHIKRYNIIALRVQKGSKHLPSGGVNGRGGFLQGFERTFSGGVRGALGLKSLAFYLEPTASQPRSSAFSARAKELVVDLQEGATNLAMAEVNRLSPRGLEQKAQTNF